MTTEASPPPSSPPPAESGDATIDLTTAEAVGSPKPTPDPTGVTAPMTARRLFTRQKSNPSSTASTPATPRPPRPARRPASPAQFSVTVTLGTLLALAVWFVFYSLVLGGVQEAHAQRVNFAHLREKLSLATVPFGGVIKPGTPVGLISAPAIGMHNVVVDEGTSSSNLEDGPGHFAASPFPGQPGNSFIFGRATTFGAPFSSIHSLKPGNTITMTTGQGVFTYTVIDVRGTGDPLPPALPSTESRLTLVTSQHRGISAGWAPGDAEYVDASFDATKTSFLQPVPSGRPTTVPSAALPFHSDTSDLIKIVLWLQLMVLFVAVTGWAWLRWTKPQTWFVAVPAGLAILWGATAAIAPLLPNLS